MLGDGCQELKRFFFLLLFVEPFVMDYFRWNSVHWLDQFVLWLLHVLEVSWGRGLNHLGRGWRLLRPHHHLRGHDVTDDAMVTITLEWILGSSEGEICTLLLLISDFYLSCWRNSSVTISDQSVRRVTTNHLCHEELITRDSLFWSLIVTPLWHHSLSPLSLWWQHSTVHSHWLQFSQTLDCVSTWHQCWQHDRHPGTDWGVTTTTDQYQDTG